MTRKREFGVRMFDPKNNRSEEKYEAASARQALLIALSDPRNQRYVDFGIVGDDGQCHMWEHRQGTPRSPRGRVGRFRDDAAIREQMGRSSTPTMDPSVLSPPPHRPTITTVSPAQLTEVFKSRVIPQLSKMDAFNARELGERLPIAYRAQWIQPVWQKVLPRLLKDGALVKADHKNYRRAAEFVPPRAQEEEVEATVVPPANGASNGHAQDVASPPPEIAATSIPAQPVPVQSPIRLLTADERVDAVLLVTTAVLTDTVERRAKWKEFSDRIMGALETIEGIRTEVDAFIKAEESVPTRLVELLSQLRAPTAATMNGGAH